MNRPLTCLSIYWILLIQWIMMASVFGQSNESYTQYTTRDGLPSNLVYEIDQDKDGYLWISTDNGISRFDGKIFQNYGYADGLKNLDVLGMEFDQFGRQWLSMIYPNLCYLQNHKLYCLPDGTFLMPGSEYARIYGPTDTTLVFFSKNQAFVLNTKTLKKHPAPENDLGIKELTPINNRVKFNNKYQGGRIIYSNIRNTLLLINDETGDSKPIFSNLQHILDKGLIKPKNIIHQDRYLELKTEVGCYFVDLKSTAQPYHIYLPGHYIHKCFFDRNLNLWITTKKSGLFKFTPQQQSHLHLEKKGDGTLKLDNITAMASQRDKLLVAQGSQLLVYDSNLNLVHSNKIALKNNEPLLKIQHKGTICHILTSHDIYEYTMENNKLLKAVENYQNQTRPYTNFKEIHVLDNNQYLLFFDRIFHLNDEKANIVNIPENPRVTIVKPLSDSMLIIGTQKGVFQYNPIKRNTAKLLTQIPKNYTVWLGTDQDQNVTIVFRDGMIKTYANTADGLELNSKYHTKNHLFNDAVVHNNRLAVASTEGLLVFKTPALELIKQFHSIDLGLESSISFIDRVQDHYVLSSDNQIVLMHDSTSSTIPNIGTRIENIQINGGNKNYTLPSKLSYDERDLTINFSTPYYQNLALSHEYQLLSHDHAPIRSIDSKATYSNLNPGKYQFQIRPIVGGHEDTPLSVYKFQISKPWWNTHLFYFLTALTLLGIVYYFYNQFKLKEKAKSNLLQYRLNAIHAQMNPHFLFNGLQSVQYYIATKDPKKAVSYLGSFATLVRKTLESSVHDYITVEDEVEYLESYLALKKEELDDNLDYEITLINEDLQSTFIPSMVLQPFLENAFVHAFTDKTESHQLHIIFTSIDTGYISCTIADNGPGIVNGKKTSNHRSFASKAIERKLKLLDQLYFKNNVENNITLLDNSKSDNARFRKGTTVKIVLPISRSAKN